MYRKLQVSHRYSTRTIQNDSHTLDLLLLYLYVCLSLPLSLPGSLLNPSREVMGDTILFRSVQIGSSAVYQCNASNHLGYLLENAFVNILSKAGRAGGLGVYPVRVYLGAGHVSWREKLLGSCDEDGGPLLVGPMCFYLRPMQCNGVS